jgi:hypothetical protein
MAIMEGDGHDGQPADGVVTIDSLADALGDDGTAPGDSEDGEDSELPEVEIESEDGEADPDADAEDEDAPEEAVFTIKVDGKEVTLKQSELIEQAQKGFDYSQKTMALAEERKAIEPIKLQAEQYRQQQEQAHTEAVNRLNAYAEYMQSQIGQPPPISLAQTDAHSYLAQKELYEARKGQLNTAIAESHRLGEEQARNRQAWLNYKAESAEKVLKDTLPGWNDAMFDDLSGYAKELGLTPQNAEQALLEPGFWQMAKKAKAYDALQAEKAKLKPVNQLPKVHKPTGQNQPPQLARRQEAIKAHRAKPSLDSLSNLL